MLFSYAIDSDRKYIPVLRYYPKAHIHEPWTASEALQTSCKCVIGKDYPLPMVHHSTVASVNSERMKQVYIQLKKYRGPGGYLH